MRVVSGSMRGRRLKEPQGMDIRPTTDQVKEAMFSIVQFELQGARVLDMFAGTGQLGIEALSRGAGECVFCDESVQSYKLIQDNLKICGIEKNAKVYRGDVRMLLPRAGKFDIIIMDPPYASGLYEECLNLIIKIDNITDNGIIICESLKEREMPVLETPFSEAKTYKYGSKKLTVYRKRAQEK